MFVSFFINQAQPTSFFSEEEVFLALALLAFAVCSGRPIEAFFVLRYIGSFGGGFFLTVLSGRIGV